jgi:hypothetical protein
LADKEIPTDIYNMHHLNKNSTGAKKRIKNFEELP